MNAYVSGFGNTKRIVLYDTILKKLTPNELMFVLGHEMGHYVLHHVVLLILTGWLSITAMLYLIHRLSGALLRRWHGRFGFDSLADPASREVQVGAAERVVEQLGGALDRTLTALEPYLLQLRLEMGAANA